MPDKSELMTQKIPDDAWTKSSFSGGGSGSECLEIAKIQGGVALRDSKNPAMRIFLTTSEYSAFLNGVRAGEEGLIL